MTAPHDPIGSLLSGIAMSERLWQRPESVSDVVGEEERRRVGVELNEHGATLRSFGRLERYFIRGSLPGYSFALDENRPFPALRLRDHLKRFGGTRHVNG
jgi:hypothetical protein